MAVTDIKPGRYRHFKGLNIRSSVLPGDSESMSPMVVYRALYGEGGLWIRPLEMFMETIDRKGVYQPRFQLIEALQE